MLKTASGRDLSLLLVIYHHRMLSLLSRAETTNMSEEENSKGSNVKSKSGTVVVEGHVSADATRVFSSESGNDGQHRDSGRYGRLRPPGPALPLQHEPPALRRLPQKRRRRDVPEVQSPAGQQT